MGTIVIKYLSVVCGRYINKFYFCSTKQLKVSHSTALLLIWAHIMYTYTTVKTITIATVYRLCTVEKEANLLLSYSLLLQHIMHEKKDYLLFNW